MIPICDLLVYGTCVEIRTLHVKAFIDDMKRTIDSSDREYDADRQVWIVALERLSVVQEVCSRHFENTLTRYAYDEPQTAKSHQAAQEAKQTVVYRDRVIVPDEHHKALYLLPGAPQSVIDAAYRALARLYHPDLGGSTEKMQRLNAAYEVLKRQ